MFLVYIERSWVTSPEMSTLFKKGTPPPMTESANGPEHVLQFQGRGDLLLLTWYSPVSRSKGDECRVLTCPRSSSRQGRYMGGFHVATGKQETEGPNKST